MSMLDRLARWRLKDALNYYYDRVDDLTADRDKALDERGRYKRLADEAKQRADHAGRNRDDLAAQLARVERKAWEAERLLALARSSVESLTTFSVAIEDDAMVYLELAESYAADLDGARHCLAAVANFATRHNP